MFGKLYLLTVVMYIGRVTGHYTGLGSWLGCSLTRFTNIFVGLLLLLRIWVRRYGSLFGELLLLLRIWVRRFYDSEEGKEGRQ
jgi:hypothetical protein